MHCLIWCSALVVMAVVVWSWDASCVHCESYCSCWFLSLHPTFMMHGHKNLKDLVLITISLLPSSQASRYADHSFPRIIKSTLLKVGTAIV